MDNGTDARRAGQVAYWVLSSFCLLSTYIFYKGFDGPVLSKPSVSKKDIKFLDLLTNGFMEAKNPRIMLAYIVSLTARADLTLKGTYIALWAVQSGMTQGFSPAKAMQQAGFVFGFMMVIGIITHFSWGFFFDRVNRVTATAVSMFFGAAGYMSMYFVPSPLDFNYLPFFALLSIGSATSIAVSIGLSGQESSPQNRGSIMGMIGLFGAVGIMITQFIGGRLFDAWGPSWPFIIVGIFQAFIMIIAIIVRILAPGGKEGKQKLAKNI
jgi:MFS family permease